MNQYTAILFAVQVGGGQAFTYSKQVSTDDKCAIYRDLKNEAKVSDEDIDTILLVRNGSQAPTVQSLIEGAEVGGAPEVFKHWRAEGGDFVECVDQEIDEEVEQGATLPEEDGLE